MKIQETYIDFLKEGYEDNFKEYEKMMLDNAYSYDDSDGDIWSKKTEHGVIFVNVHSDRNRYEQVQWNIYFIPYVKVEKKMFGLWKKRMQAKVVDIANNKFDFGVGLFKVDDKKEIKNFERLLKTIDKRIKNIKPEWEKPEGHANPNPILYKNSKDWTKKIF